MKRILIMLLWVAVVLPIMAQDIIVTTSSERIDAQVTEVSDTEVKYKRTDNLDGPVFVIATSKISSIIYQNGDVQTFAQATQGVHPQSTTNGTVVGVRKAEDIMFVPGQKIEVSAERGKYYYGNIELDEPLFRDFIKLSCDDAYKTYMNGVGMMNGGGWTSYFITCVGLGVMFAKSSEALIAGSIISVVGLAAGTTFVVVGSKKKEQALDIFNNQCSSSLHARQAVTLNIGTTSTGLGLTLNF